MTALLGRKSQIGADANDDYDLALRKSLLVLLAFLFMLAGVAWGLMYFWFGETRAGLIPFTYSIFSLISVIYFGYTGRDQFFRFSQLFLILLLPFFLMMALGGYISSSAVILWSFICPMGAMMFDEPRHAPTTHRY